MANPGLYKAAFENKSLALSQWDVDPSTLAKLYNAEKFLLSWEITNI